MLATKLESYLDQASADQKMGSSKVITLPRSNQKIKSSTKTSAFGVSKREGHDATAFYSRFQHPVISDDITINPSPIIDQVICGNAKKMSKLADNSVALVITSPPYFVGKEYEDTAIQKKAPKNYLAYLNMLQQVFTECYRVLEPGGRIAINVANLGRKPYRSLSADVIRILQDEIGFLLRGEIIWQKAQGASGNCAWGSFALATNPVLRDLSERIIIASKGRFDRAIPTKKRKELGLPFESTITKEDFMSFTLDVWNMPPESARRVGHPAPYPVELPRRLIELYTFRDDIVLDPFLGSGTTAVAAIRTNRHYIGYDLDDEYCKSAERRIAAEKQATTTKSQIKTSIKKQIVVT